MGYTSTSELSLRKDDNNEPVANLNDHLNSNLDLLDAAIKNLRDAKANAEALLGVLGYNSNNEFETTAEEARATLGAATSGGAASTLYAAEQAIATNAGLIATNTSNISNLQNTVNNHTSSISSLQDSVGVLHCATDHGGVSNLQYDGHYTINGVSYVRLAVVFIPTPAQIRFTALRADGVTWDNLWTK